MKKEEKLITIGNISPHARKKLRIISDSEYLNIPKNFISMLVGLIDGDGYIHLGNSGKNFIKLNLVISLNERDKPLLEEIQKTLKLGTVTHYPKLKTCKFIIYRTDLQEIFFPLLKYHNIFFLTSIRNKQYNKALYVLNNNISKYSDIDYKHNQNNNINLSPQELLNLHFYKNWLVGFVMADGSFLVKKNKDICFICFNIKQRIEKNLFKSFQLLFDSKNKIHIEKDKYMLFMISSKYHIQLVINFFSFEGNYPLQGYKAESYYNWINNLKNSSKYKDLKLPNV